MKLHNLKSTPFSRPSKHRVGRGHAAGKGKQAGKGQSGQNKRGGTRPGFEGGQNPWFRRLPKRGFKNVNRIEYDIITLADINKCFKDGSIIDENALVSCGLLKKSHLAVKVLANGTLTLKNITLKVNAISENAKNALKKVGGKVEVL